MSIVLQAAGAEACWVSRTPAFADEILMYDRPIAFLKSYSTRSAQDTARDAVQIFGGRGITNTGMGRFIDHVRFSY